MKYAVAFGIISITFLTASFQYPSLRFLFLWMFVSFVTVGLGYAGLGTKALGKRPDGKIPWYFILLNTPYLLYTWLVWHLFRIVSQETAVDRFDENLSVGRRLLPSELPDGFECYVDLTVEFEDPQIIQSNEAYLCFPILDASIPTTDALRSAVEKVGNKKTYIHCAQGHGRTGLFALALLHHRGQILNFEEGIKLLKEARPAIRLNRKQTNFIRSYLESAQRNEKNP